MIANSTASAREALDRGLTPAAVAADPSATPSRSWWKRSATRSGTKAERSGVVPRATPMMIEWAQMEHSVPASSRIRGEEEEVEEEAFSVVVVISAAAERVRERATR